MLQKGDKCFILTSEKFNYCRCQYRRGDTDGGLRVLGIAAHPDDLELRCGGMLNLHADRGGDVSLLNLTELGDAQVHRVRASRY